MLKLLLPSALLSLAVACASATPPPPVVAKVSIPPAPPSQPAAPAAVELEQPGLGPADISRVIAARQSAVGGCYAIAYGADEEPGALTVGLQIAPDGSVRAAEVMDSSFADATFHDCVLRVARELHFPTASGETEVAWRYRFGRSSSATAAQAAY